MEYCLLFFFLNNAEELHVISLSKRKRPYKMYGKNGQGVKRSPPTKTQHTPCLTSPWTRDTTGTFTTYLDPKGHGRATLWGAPEGPYHQPDTTNCPPQPRCIKGSEHLASSHKSTSVPLLPGSQATRMIRELSPLEHFLKYDTTSHRSN